MNGWGSDTFLLNTHNTKTHFFGIGIGGGCDPLLAPEDPFPFTCCGGSA